MTLAAPLPVRMCLLHSAAKTCCPLRIAGSALAGAAALIRRRASLWAPRAGCSGLTVRCVCSVRPVRGSAGPRRRPNRRYAATPKAAQRHRECSRSDAMCG
jgi:hypothetical protein